MPQNYALSEKEIKFIMDFIKSHVEFHFETEVVDIFNTAKIKPISWENLDNDVFHEENTILLPIDAPTEPCLNNIYQAELRNTKCTIWYNHKNLPDSWMDGKTKNKFFLSTQSKLLTPRFDLLKLIFESLTLNEEQGKSTDRFGRFNTHESQRYQNLLIGIPVVNNAVAILVDMVMEISGNGQKFAKPPSVCISHDLDQLRGDDFWTQSARVYRFLKSLKNIRAIDWKSLKAVFANIFNPEKYYLGDFRKMLLAEKKNNFFSVSYILCGKRGRFFARTRNIYLKKYISEFRDLTELGMHYNFHTLNNQKAFQKQKRKIEEWVDRPIISGRAHYLKLKSDQDLRFWNDNGIKIDETLGYPDVVGFRAGLAGPYRPFDKSKNGQSNIIAVPLVAMDAACFGKGSEQGLENIEKIIAHLSVIGGTFTFLIHPGYYDNPEYPEYKGSYDKLLDLLKSYNVRSITPNTIVNELI